MKVYIVRCGDYGDNGVEAVFTNEEQAQLFCDLHCGYEVEEWETDEIKITPEDIVVNCQILFDGEFRKMCITSSLSLEPQKVQIYKNQGFYPDSNQYIVNISVKKGTAEKEAVNIARDYLVKYLKEQIENEKAKLSKAMEGLADES